jgi:flavorubredoxin
MVKVFIFYDSKYGNTKLAAEEIAEGMRAAGVEVSLGYVKEVDPGAATICDAIVLGAPNHMGSPSRAMKSFIDELAKVELKAGFVAVFGTYAGRERSQDRAEKKLEALSQKKFFKLKLLLPGLSVHVHGVSGPLINGELSKCVEYGRRIVSELA